MKKILLLASTLLLMVFFAIPTSANSTNFIIRSPSIIYKGSNAFLTAKQIQSLIKFADGTVPKILEDGYTGKGHLAGPKEIKFGNEKNKDHMHTLTINVIKALDEYIVYEYPGKLEIETTVAKKLNKEEYAKIFKAIGKISTNATNVNLIINDDFYQASSDEGFYDGSYNISSSSGDSHSGILSIKVVSNANDNLIKNKSNFFTPTVQIVLFSFTALVISLILITIFKRKKPNSKNKGWFKKWRK